MDSPRALRPLLVLFVLACASLSAAGQSGDLPAVSDAQLAAAYQTATGQPPPSTTTLRYEDKPDPGGTFARSKTTKQGNGTYVTTITVYGRSFVNAFGLAAFNNPNIREGLICGTFLHELQHECISENGGGSGEASPNDRYSCEHIAITYGSVMAACSEVSALKSQANSQTPPDAGLLDKAKGLCSYINQKRQDYNTPDGATAAKDCYCGGTWVPPTACPNTQLPPFPPGSSCTTGYPNNQIIPPCEACSGL